MVLLIHYRVLNVGLRAKWRVLGFLDIWSLVGFNAKRPLNFPGSLTCRQEPTKAESAPEWLLIKHR